jgi:gliding motility-associated lipoprotein GldD
MNKFLCLLFISFLIIACDQDPVPREKGYHRVYLPERNYVQFDKPECMYTFEYPAFADVSWNDPDPCWMDFYFKPFHCNWHFTYRSLKGDQESRNLEFEEYRRLVYKHTIKATQIREIPIRNAHVKGTLFEMYGNVPTSAQLFLTDLDNQHVMEISFYFYTSMRNDSLAPVIDYVKEDLLHLAETFRWKSSSQAIHKAIHQ